MLHSVTKYIAGHNDVLAGALIGRSELITEVFSTSLAFPLIYFQISKLHNVLGGVIDPFASYMIIRGMKTLKVSFLVFRIHTF